MEPRYSIKEEKGAFFIYPPDGKEWVAACIDKEEAEKLCAEKNKNLQAETHYTAVFRDENGKPRECKIHIEHINLADVKDFEPPQEKPEKPKKKRIPKVLRPELILPENEWRVVSRALTLSAESRLERATKECRTMFGRALHDIKVANKLIRLAQNIDGQVYRYCDAIRNPEDDDTPF